MQGSARHYIPGVSLLWNKDNKCKCRKCDEEDISFRKFSLAK
jgi:hypothetical protein